MKKNKSSLSYFEDLLYKSDVFHFSKIIFQKRKLDIYFCPFLKNENTFGKNKYVKIREKTETIKKIKVSCMKKVFQNCDDKFFYENILISYKNLGTFLVSIYETK